MNFQQQNEFLFAPKYRVWRHFLFWTFQVLFFALIYSTPQRGLKQELLAAALWVPARMLFCYLLMYWVVPRFLLRERYAKFSVILLLWAIVGWIANYLYKAYFFIPVQEALHFDDINRGFWQPGSYISTLATAGAACMIVLFKHWMQKQQEFMQAEKEKVTAELQLLKAQVHPHFLFNTLNNIYSFSLEASPKTPALILKLSSLLSYILYDCKEEEVLLEKELEVMKNYIDLEKERYGNKLDVSLNVEGDMKDQFIAPLLLLPFLENGFKHGTSEQLEKPWLSMDLVVRQNTLRCKIANSKNETVLFSHTGIGIQNVKRRLQFLYPDRHELKIADEESFFVVSLLIELKDSKRIRAELISVTSPVKQKVLP